MEEWGREEGRGRMGRWREGEEGGRMPEEWVKGE